MRREREWRPHGCGKQRFESRREAEAEAQRHPQAPPRAYCCWECSAAFGEAVWHLTSQGLHEEWEPP